MDESGVASGVRGVLVAREIGDAALDE